MLLSMIEELMDDLSFPSEVAFVASCTCNTATVTVLASFCGCDGIRPNCTHSKSNPPVFFQPSCHTPSAKLRVVPWCRLLFHV